MPDTLSHRNAYRRVGVAVLTVCYLNLTACSIFGGSSQSLTVNSDPPGSQCVDQRHPRRHDTSSTPGFTPGRPHGRSTKDRLHTTDSRNGPETQQRRHCRCHRRGVILAAAPRPHCARRLGAGPASSESHSNPSTLSLRSLNNLWAHVSCQDRIVRNRDYD